MKLSRVLGTMVLAAAAFGAATAARAGTTVQVVRGKLAATATDGTTTGGFRLVDVEHNGATFQNLFVLAGGLDSGGATDATFEVVLDNGTTQADLGPLHLFGRTKTRGWLRFDTRKDTLPAGVTDLSTFSGGTLHVQLAGADVATAPIAAFVGPEGPPPSADTPSSAVAFGYGSVILGDPSWKGAGPVAKVQAFAGNGSGGVVQAIGVAGLRFAAGTYTVVLTGASEDVVGTFTAGGFFGWGGLVLNTRNGDVIPGGSVSALAGRGVEIRDATGAAVLTGVFPSLN